MPCVLLTGFLVRTVVVDQYKGWGFQVHGVRGVGFKKGFFGLRDV